MKWAIVGLSVLGLAAAACAALLVGILRAGNMPARGSAVADGEVKVLYAVHDLEPMTVIEGEMVATKTIRRSEAPAQSIADPVQVVGRVLTIPLIKGQAFTTTNFATESNASLAAAVSKGKRAVGISVTDYAGLTGLLYPGSVVDVVVTLKPSEGFNDQKFGAMAKTLLERVQVLAIEKQTVVSGSADQVGDAVDNGERYNATRRITLLVDSRQAKTLQLGMSQGTLSLALRNPLDTGEADSEDVSMNSITGREDAPAASKGPSKFQQLLMTLAAAQAKAKAPAQTKDVFAADPAAAPVEIPQWKTTVIRGEASSVVSFPIEGKPSPTTEATPAQSTATTARKLEAETR